MKNKKEKSTTLSRRQFIGTSSIFATGLALSAKSVFAAPNILKHYGTPISLINGVQIGVITYSYRSLPDQSAEATLKYVVDSGISAIELMGDPAESFAGKPVSTIDRRTYYMAMRKARNNADEMTEEEKKDLDDMKAEMEAYNEAVLYWRANVTMDKFEEMKKMYADSGVSIYAFKPSTFGRNNTDAEIDYGFRAAKALGANQVTVELPGDAEFTKKLGEFAAKHKIYIAYHGHLQQTPTWWDTALGQSEYNAMNLDLGHYVAAGQPGPLDLVKANHDRIKSMHIKDRQNKENGQANLPFGQGDTPVIEVLQLMRDQKYTFPATIELEYKVPEDSDPVTEVQKCFEYCRKALEG